MSPELEETMTPDDLSSILRSPQALLSSNKMHNTSSSNVVSTDGGKSLYLNCLVP